MIRALVVLLLVGFLAGADDAKPTEAAKKDLDKLQGDWTFVSGKRDGQDIPEEFGKSLIRTVTGDKSVVTRDGEVLVEGTLKLDPSKTPKELDLAVKDSDAKIQGIYELDGETLKISYSQPGSPRPTKFESEAGSGVTVATWKRAKKS